ncbi:hypothetical protein NC651_039104 [Populus alba x Populus x berolinensis]|jgi:hypothetical protein|nr:hypothetical protein NC651_039104 [Populus alba x Populus x berolinensis]
MEVKTSPPNNIKMVMMISWVLEKTSISTVDMLETVAEETEVKKMSRLAGLNEPGLGFETFKAICPTKERITK